MDCKRKKIRVPPVPPDTTNHPAIASPSFLQLQLTGRPRREIHRRLKSDSIQDAILQHHPYQDMPRNLKPYDVEWRSGITATREDVYSTPIALKMPGQPVNQMQKIIDTTRRLSATSALSISIKHTVVNKKKAVLYEIGFVGYYHPPRVHRIIPYLHQTFSRISFFSEFYPPIHIPPLFCRFQFLPSETR